MIDIVEQNITFLKIIMYLNSYDKKTPKTKSTSDNF